MPYCMIMIHCNMQLMQAKLMIIANLPNGTLCPHRIHVTIVYPVEENYNLKKC